MNERIKTSDWTIERKNKLMSKQTSERMTAQTNELMNEWLKKQTKEWMSEVS